ncbi:MAG: hypothetical protein HYS17_00290 [Micavibrio aeruginosavorus]|uniref:Uncharacterized protein n=1 Tax=Micavibrio aeruginosavorus TaxID=349221 RepID=A0A7T5R2H8_9BACT|nr:MAG: hypothetical protein HYS17_00290 [Micavibrio aeruginosavorus]
MTMTYRAARDPVTSQLALFVRQKEGLPFNARHEYPVAIFSGATEAFPLEAQKVAENMADLLNHRTPLHKLSSGGARIFYSRTDDSIILRTRKCAGVSVPALTLMVSSKSSVADLGQDILTRMDQVFMKRVCDLIIPEKASAPDLQQKRPEPPAVP